MFYTHANVNNIWFIPGILVLQDETSERLAGADGGEALHLILDVT